MEFLFRIEDEERSKRHNRMFLIINIIGYTSVIVPSFVASISAALLGVKAIQFTISCFLLCAAQIYTVGFFFLAVIRM